MTVWTRLGTLQACGPERTPDQDIARTGESPGIVTGCFSNKLSAYQLALASRLSDAKTQVSISR